MSFSYPAADNSVIAGNGFYRIKADAASPTSSDNTQVSPGDLIPINVGFQGIAVGPESDYDRYALYYPNSLAPGGYERMEFSIGHPLLGLFSVDAVGGASSENNGEPAQAFIQPLGLPMTAFISGANTIIQTQTDVVVYTGFPPSFVPTKRGPRIFSGYVPIIAGTNVFKIPCFGRRHLAFHAVANGVGGAALTYHVRGNNIFEPREVFDLNQASSFKAGKITWTTDLLVPTALGLTAAYSYDCVTGGKGFFHYLEARIVSDTAFLPSDQSSGLTPGVHVHLEVRDI